MKELEEVCILMSQIVVSSDEKTGNEQVIIFKHQLSESCDSSLILNEIFVDS